MTEEDNLTDYSLPVYTALQEKQLFFGVGETAFSLIAMITMILIAMVSIYCVVIGLVALFICQRLCKKEPLLIEFLMQNLLQEDTYLG